MRNLLGEFQAMMLLRADDEAESELEKSKRPGYFAPCPQSGDKPGAVIGRHSGTVVFSACSPACDVCAEFRARAQSVRPKTVAACANGWNQFCKHWPSYRTAK